MQIIQHSTIVFDRRGHKASYVAKTEDGHIVRPYYDILMGDGEVDEDLGDVTCWNEVFLEPPVIKLNEEVAKLNQEIEKLQQTRNELLYAKGETDKEIKERETRIKRHKQLELLDKYLTNGITHYVQKTWNGIHIISFDDTKSEDYPTKGQFKFLTLFGDSKGDLSWHLQDYYTKHSSEQVYPCISEQEAKNTALKLFEDLWAEWREQQSKGKILNSFLTNAKALGFGTPQDIEDYYYAEKIKLLEKKASDAQNNAEIAMAELVAAKQ